MIDEQRLRMFIRESNYIERVDGDLSMEFPMAAGFLSQESVTLGALEAAVSIFEPGAKLRRKVGMDVRVGKHVAPAGGPEIRTRLENLLTHMHKHAPYAVHRSYEELHPFTDGNGRSGRLLWLWMMVKRDGQMPPLGFLHTWYYSSLAASHD